MKRSVILFALSTVLSVAAQVANAQLLTVTHGSYFLDADAKVGDQRQHFTESDTVFVSSFSKGFHSEASVDDGSLAWSSSSINWGGNGVNTLSGGGGGIAHCEYYGTDTYANGTGVVSIYFDISTAVHAALDSEGTYDSNIYVFDGTNYVPFYTGLVGVDNVVMDAGHYRWDTGSGASTSGFDEYSAGVFVTASVTAVPEPSTILLSAGGLSALALRRRVKSA